MDTARIVREDLGPHPRPLRAASHLGLQPAIPPGRSLADAVMTIDSWRGSRGAARRQGS